MFRNRLSAGDRFSLAFDTAYPIVKRSHNIRLNHMFVHGEDAVRLAKIGAALLGKPTTSDDREMHFNYYPDYVALGAEQSFKMLRGVLVPMSRLYGPGGFRVVPCTTEGIELKLPVAKATSDAFDDAARSRVMSSIGEGREDYWHAAAAGVAGQVTSMSLSDKKIVRATQHNALARFKNSTPYAWDMLRVGAEQVAGPVRVGRNAGLDGVPLESVLMRVEPAQGLGLSSVVTLNFDGTTSSHKIAN